MVRKGAGGIQVWAVVGVLLGALMLAIALAPMSQAASPLRIGFGMALTGGLAANGKAALLAMELWRDEINKHGGLLGRPVEFVYYDDQTKPASIPGIYTKLLDVDGVDFVVSGYGTNLIAPAMPIVIERNLVFMALFGLANNEKLNHPYYFQIMPAGPEPAKEFSRGFFEIAAAQNPKLRTAALVGADAVYPLTAMARARRYVTQAG